MNDVRITGFSELTSMRCVRKFKSSPDELQVSLRIVVSNFFKQGLNIDLRHWGSHIWVLLVQTP